MRKILSIFLAVLMLCQCFTTIGVFASEGVTEAPTKLLMDIEVANLVSWNQPNGNANGVPVKLNLDNGTSTTPMSGNSNTYFFVGTNAKTLKNGTYEGMEYVVASNPVNGQWGIFGDTKFNNFPDKTTFELTFLDKSTEDNKRTSGTGCVFAIYGGSTWKKECYYVGTNAASTENYMYPSSNTSAKFGAANRWIDLKIETVENNDVKTKSSWWKYHEEGEDAWKQLENKVATDNKVYAVLFGAMSDNSGDTAEILINKFTATRTYRPEITEVTVDGTAIENGETGISCGTNEITVTFDQTMADGMEDKIKLTAVGGADADVTVSTSDDKTYTITIDEDLLGSTSYALDLSECVSLHDLIAEEEFTFETGASPVITVTAQGDVSAINWKQSNTINIEFSSPVVPSTVNEESVKLCYADGTPAGDVPMIVEAAPYGAAITVGQLEAWSDYKLVFANTIAPASEENIFNTSEVYFGTDHADVVEYDYNKSGSKNGKVSSGTVYGFPAATTDYVDASTGIKYASIETSSSSSNVALDGAPTANENLVMSYKLRANASAGGSIFMAGSGWCNYISSGFSAGIVTATDTISFAGTNPVNMANDGNFHDYKFNMALSADGTKRNTTGYVLGQTGWELHGPSREYTKSTGETLHIFKYWKETDAKAGPFDIARIVVSTSPKADVMKSYVDYETREITVSLGKNMAEGNEDKIAVKIGDTTVDSTATQINSNTYTIKLDEVIQPNTAYTIDMSSLVCADGVIGAQSYTFTTPAAAIETPVFTINGNAGSVQVKNNTGDSLTYTVIVAVYDKGNMLKAVETVTNTIFDGATSETHTVTADLSQYASADKTGWTSKLMVWKGDITAATPIRAAIGGTIQ